MILRHDVLGGANRLLDRLGLHLIPVDEYEMLRRSLEGPEWKCPEIPAAAQQTLRWDNPDLADLELRYSDHPAAPGPHWQQEHLKASLNLLRFRGENHYVQQVRFAPGEATYFMTAYYIEQTDKLGLFGTLTEDGLFGAYTVDFHNGYVISRDLLDSINQTNMIARVLGSPAGWRVLDIGAGYGRLAHRLAEGVPGVHVTCTDAVPLSTFLSSFYLSFRGLDDRTTVVPLDLVDKQIKGKPFDIVTNFHGFSECPLSAVSWWLCVVDHVSVSRMLVVPNRTDQFLSTEADESHLDFAHLFTEHGWRRTHSEPVYAQSTVTQRCGLYPHFRFHVFER